MCGLIFPNPNMVTSCGQLHVHGFILCSLGWRKADFIHAKGVNFPLQLFVCSS
jgi:hypothetical protein